MRTLKRMFASVLSDMETEGLATRIAIGAAIVFILMLPGFVLLLGMCCGVDELEDRFNGKGKEAVK